MFSMTDSINIKVTDILKLSNRAVIAFINRRDKKVWISYTNSMLTSLERNITLLKSGMHSIQELNADIEHLEVIVLEEHPSKRYLKHRIKHYYDQYISDGYSMYKKDLLVQYKFKIKIYKGLKKVKLYLEGNCRNNKILVGEFDKMYECEDYMNRGLDNCLKEILD